MIARILNRLRIESRKLWLRGVNTFGRRRVIQSSGPVVSLTTHGRRTKSVFFTIESIAAGSVLPSRIILWIDAGSDLTLPGSLRRLAKRGLEVRPTRDFGPHTKYYPYVSMESDFSIPLVTADDDILYPVKWLSQLSVANAKFPEDISCHRAARVILNADGIAPYASWPRCASTRPSILNFATGVSGVIYPPHFLELLKERGTEFLSVAAKADDIWLHRVAVLGGVQVRQISAQSVHFDEVFRGDRSGLMHANVAGGGNDRQIEMSYSTDDLAALRLATLADAER